MRTPTAKLERQPLLRKNEDDEDTIYFSYGEHSSIPTVQKDMSYVIEKGKEKKLGLWVELWELFLIALPVSSTYLSGSFCLWTDFFFIAHINSKMLAAATVGGTWWICTDIVAVGFCNAMDSLSTQAAGADNDRLQTKYLVHGIVIMTVMFFPLAMLWYFTEDILLLFGFEDELAALAGIYTKILIPGSLPELWYRVAQKWLQGKGIVRPSMYAGILQNVLNIIFNYVFIWGIPLGHSHRVIGGWGFIGSPLATTTSKMLLLPLSLLFTLVVPSYRQGVAWEGFTFRLIFDWRGLLTFLRVGLPAASMLAMEEWSYGLLTIFAALASELILNTYSICTIILTGGYCIALGGSVAASVRVGNALGDGSAKRAKQISWICLILSIPFFMTTAACLAIFRWLLAYLFTPDPTLRASIAAALPFLALNHLMDGITQVLGGIVRGVGLPGFGAAVTLISYYLVGIPLAALCLLVFHTGVEWIFISVVVGLSFLMFLEVALMLVLNWNKRALAALQLLDRMVEEDSEWWSETAAESQLEEETEGEYVSDEDEDDIFSVVGAYQDEDPDLDQDVVPEDSERLEPPPLIHSSTPNY